VVADVQGLQPGGADRDLPPEEAGAEGGEAGHATVVVEETRGEDVQPQDRLPQDLLGHPRPVHLGPRPLGPLRDRRGPGPEITKKILVVVERDARVESESPERRIARLAEIKRQLRGRDKKRHRRQQRLRQRLNQLPRRRRPPPPPQRQPLSPKRTCLLLSLLHQAKRMLLRSLLVTEQLPTGMQQLLRKMARTKTNGVDHDRQGRPVTLEVGAGLGVVAEVDLQGQNLGLGLDRKLVNGHPLRQSLNGFLSQTLHKMSIRIM